MQRSSVDLPPPEGPQITIRSLRLNLQAHVAQRVERAEPLVETHDLDRDLVMRGADIRGGAARRVRWLLKVVAHDPARHPAQRAFNRRSVNRA